jgi:hypothetical protein
MKRMLAATLALAIAAVAGCRKRESGPEDAFAQLQAGLRAKDGAKVWHYLATESRFFFDNLAKEAKTTAGDIAQAKPWMVFLGCSQAELAGIDGEKVVIFHMRTMDRTDDQHNHFAVVRDARAVYDIVNKLTKADGKMSRGDGKGFENIFFEFEDRMWKVNFESVQGYPGYLRYFHGPKREGI